MDKVEEIPLTAKGKTMEQAFSNIAINLFSKIVNLELVQSNLTKTILIREKNLKALLYQYLKKIYDLALTETILVSKVHNVKIESINEDYLLTAVDAGEKLKPEHKLNNTIKMLTDRNIVIKEDKDGCNLQINIIVENKDEV